MSIFYDQYFYFYKTMQKIRKMNDIEMAELGQTRGVGGEDPSSEFNGSKCLSISFSLVICSHITGDRV
jgi:hypothetical protein